MVDVLHKSALELFKASIWLGEPPTYFRMAGNIQWTVAQVDAHLSRVIEKRL